MPRFALVVAFVLAAFSLALPSAHSKEELKLTWRPAESEAAKLAQAALQRNKILPLIVKGLDDFLVFPRELPIVFAETGKINAWYSPSEHSVTMSYDLTVFLAQLFHGAGLPPDRAMEHASDAMLFILLHELGHAFIGELDLPTTGREEDAADEFATMQAALIIPKAYRGAARAAADWFKIMASQKQDLSQLAFWDEHSLDAQRAYKILSNLYAADPKAHRFVEKQVPLERLQVAQLRFHGIGERWARLLSPWREKNAFGERGGWIWPLDGHRPKDQGTFRIVLGEATTESARIVHGALIDGRAHELVAQVFDRGFLWPNDVTLVIGSGVGKTTQYNQRKHRGDLSLDFLWDQAPAIFDRHGIDQGADTLGKTLFYLLMQETIFIAIQEFDIPYTGELEDAAAEFIAIMLSSEPGLDPFALAATRWYGYLMEDPKRLDEIEFWGLSSLDQQRFFDTMALLHAAHPARYAGIKTVVPASRLSRTAWELPRKQENWDRLLTPWTDQNYATK